jgi:hypothetical protein
VQYAQGGYADDVITEPGRDERVGMVTVINYKAE